MIIPRVSEEEWRLRLSGLPAWTPEARPTCVISPHPDDETLGAGGLISRLRSEGVPVTVVAVTDGENAYEDEEELGRIRAEEQIAALRHLGIDEDDVIRLRLPDSGLQSREIELRNIFSTILSSDMQVIAPWTRDFHPDHEVCGRAAREVSIACNASLLYYFFWTWHRGCLGDLNGLDLCSFQLTEDAFAAKNQALLCHRSQLSRQDGEPILPADLLMPMNRHFEVYLPR